MDIEEFIIRFFMGEKGVMLRKDLHEFLVSKFGKNAEGVEKLFGAVMFAFFSFFVFPNIIKPLILSAAELVGGEKK